MALFRAVQEGGVVANSEASVILLEAHSFHSVQHLQETVCYLPADLNEAATAC